MFRQNIKKRIIRSFFYFARQHIKLFLITKGIIVTQKKVLRLTPNSFRRQVFYDTEKKKKFEIFLRNNIDFRTFNGVYINEHYNLKNFKRDVDIENLYKTILQTNRMPLIIDCGANIGLAGKFFSQKYTHAKILCIEPDKHNINQAKLNNNDNPNIVFIESAIGSQPGSANIFDPGLGNDAYRISLDKKGKVQVISVNELLVQYDSSKYSPFIIKIDIEGFEDELFSKNTDWIDEFPVIIIELHDWMLPGQNNASNFIKTFSGKNRDFIIHGENIFSIRNPI